MNYLIRFIRLIISMSIVYVSYFFLKEPMTFFINETVDHVVIDGMPSLWSQIAGIFMGLIVFMMTILTSGSWRESKFNKIYVMSCVISCLVMSPVITVVMWYQLHAKSEGFVECKELRKSSRRYSSRTYAVSELVCERLLEERDRKRSGWETD